MASKIQGDDDADELEEARKFGLPEGWRMRFMKNGTSFKRRFWDPQGNIYDTVVSVEAVLGYRPDGYKGRGKRRRDNTSGAATEVSADNDDDKNEKGEGSSDEEGEDSPDKGKAKRSRFNTSGAATKVFADDDGNKNESRNSAVSDKNDDKFAEGWEATMGYEKYVGARARWLPEGWREATAIHPNFGKSGRRKVYVSPTGCSRYDQKNVIKCHERELAGLPTTNRSWKKQKIEESTSDRPLAEPEEASTSSSPSSSSLSNEKGEDSPDEEGEELADADELEEARKLGLPEGWRIRLTKNVPTFKRRFWDPQGNIYDTVGSVEAVLGHRPEGYKGKGKGRRDETSGAATEVSADNDDDKNEKGEGSSDEKGEDSSDEEGEESADADEFEEARTFGLPEGWRIRWMKNGKNLRRRFWDPQGTIYNKVADVEAVLGHRPEGYKGKARWRGDKGKGKGRRDNTSGAATEVSADNDDDKNEKGEASQGKEGEEAADADELEEARKFGLPEGWRMRWMKNGPSGKRRCWDPQGNIYDTVVSVEAVLGYRPEGYKGKGRRRRDNTS